MQTEPHPPPLRRRPMSPSYSGTLEPPLVRSAAMVMAPVELRRATGSPTTRSPKPQCALR